MKKSSKNNFSGKNKKKQHNNSGSNFYSRNPNSPKNNDRFPINTYKNKGLNDFNESNEKKVKYSSSRNKPIVKSNVKVPRRSNDIYQELAIKKNFDDWIWGKHSVFEALINERAINRIWCTSEIYSSEKFYILLKDLKTKGVLIEEVSWNRLSQLTFGATHQGVALQLSCSKTISLEKLIEF